MSRTFPKSVFFFPGAGDPVARGKKCRTIFAGMLVMLVGGLSSLSHAATFTWNVAGGGDWNTAGNWSSTSGTTPTNGSNVNINASGGIITGNPTSGDRKYHTLNLDNGTVQDHDRVNGSNTGTWTVGDGNAGNGTAKFEFANTVTFRGVTFTLASDGAAEATNVLIGHGSSTGPATLNLNGGTFNIANSIDMRLRQTTFNLNGGSLNVGGAISLSGGDSAVRAINVSSGSLSADQYTTNGWGTGEDLAFHITGSDASSIEFRQWNIDDNSGGVGTLSYTLEPGETVTPITLTDASNPFGGTSAATLFSDNFTLSMDGSGVDDTFDSDLVLFELTNAADFDGLSQLTFSDFWGTSARGEDDYVSILTSSGKTDFLLHFNNLRAGNFSGNQEIWLENYVTPVPEPSSFLLLGLGILALRGRKRRV